MVNNPSQQDANNEFQPKTKAMSEREAVSTLTKSLFDNKIMLYEQLFNVLCC